MPYSSNTFDDVLVDHVNRLNPEKVLDVGAGAGKNSKLIHDRCLAKPKEIHAVEPTSHYVDLYSLKKSYEHVYQMDIITWLKNNSETNYDLVLMTDVLEHLFKSEVFDVLDSILYRTSWLIAIWPTNLPQDARTNIENHRINNPYEIHKCNLSLSDLSSNYNVHYYVKQYGWHNYNDFLLPKVDFHYAVISGLRTRTDSSIYNFQIWDK